MFSHGKMGHSHSHLWPFPSLPITIPKQESYSHSHLIPMGFPWELGIPFPWPSLLWHHDDTPGSPPKNVGRSRRLDVACHSYRVKTLTAYMLFGFHSVMASNPLPLRLQWTASGYLTASSSVSRLRT